jgi:hypothetical protein
MLCGMMLGSFFRVVCSMQMVTVRDVCVMSGLFMAATGVVLGRFFVMTRCVFVMFCRFCMMFCALLGHGGFEG